MIDENQNNYSNELELKSNEGKNKNSFKIILGILSVVIIALVVFLIYYIVSMKKPEKAFTNITNYIFNSMENLVDTNFNLEESGLITGDFKINTTSEEYKNLNNAVFNYNFGYDIKNKKAEFGFGFDEDGKKIIFTDTQIKDNNIYINLDDLFNKIILMDNNTFEENYGMSINEIFTNIEDYYKKDKNKDILYIIEQMRLITNKAFKSVKYEKENTKININDKEINATKLILDLNKENISTIVLTYINEIRNNEELVGKIANVLEIEKKEIIDNLKSIEEDIEIAEETNSNASIVIYTTGLFSDIVKISYILDEKEDIYYINKDNYKEINIYDFNIVINNKELSIKYNNEVKITGIANTFELNNIDFAFESKDKDMPFKGTIKYNNKKDKLSFNINLEVTTETNIKLNIDGNNNKVNEKEYSSTTKIALEIDSEKVEFTNTMKMLIGEEIATKEVNDTINFNDLSDNDLSSIEENFNKKLKNSKLGELLLSDGIEESKESFARKSNSVVDSARNAISSIESNNLSDEYYTKEGTEKYCFTVNDLINANLLNSKYSSLEGTITISKIRENYIYKIELANEFYYIQKSSSSVSEYDVKELELNDLSFIKTTCTNS